ncbi:MAG: C40 family peptidase, partial [Lachnospiraceae bacterium]|nr:C40 family peptidase [Lachnospiraceae bacterium]
GASTGSTSSDSSVSLGRQIADYALQFVGNPYVYGGTSLTDGADCSGFVQSVYKNFGILLPRTSGEQGACGISVGGLDAAQPGDLIYYSGHIGIYIGNGQIVHASTSQSGIKVSSANFRPILSVRRIV